MLNHQGTRKLETSRLILRKFTLADAQDMFNNWASDPIVTKYLAWPPHPDIETSQSIIDAWIISYEHVETYQWAIEVKDINQVIGTITLMHVNNHSEKCEIGYCIGKEFWNKGIMTEAFKAVMDYTFSEVGFNRIEARYHVGNDGSGKVMTKCGLKYEGCLRQSIRNGAGKLVDCEHYSILKEDYQSTDGIIYNKIEGISHITFVVEDLERTSKIFEYVLDGKLVYSSGSKEYSLSKEKFYLIGNQWIAIMQGEKLASKTYNHVAFKIDIKDFNLYKTKVQDLGLEIKQPRSRINGEAQSLYFYDYDNHLFELHTGTLNERLQKYKTEK